MVKTPNPSTGVPSSIPGQGTRSCMHAVTKKSTCCNGDPASHSEETTQPK